MRNLNAKIEGKINNQISKSKQNLSFSPKHIFLSQKMELGGLQLETEEYVQVYRGMGLDGKVLVSFNQYIIRVLARTN